MPRSPHSSEAKAHAVALAAEHGVAHAHRETGISKSTISRACKAAGVDVQRTAVERTARAVAVNTATGEERRSRLADRLLELAELGTEATIAAMEGAALRDLVGVWTRAIHDHQLLSGGATSRLEGGDVRAAAADTIDELAARREKAA